jgi:hypothetical protein
LHALPQLPQLAALVNWTQAPLHALKPLLHVYPQTEFVQRAVALATEVEQAFPQLAQLLGSLVTSTQDPEQSVGAAPGHPETHE